VEVVSEPTCIPEVLSRHAEEAAFLWLQRDRAVEEPQYTPRELAELDGRVEAHLDGLRVAGEDGIQRMFAEFEEHPEPGEAFASAVLAFEQSDHMRIVGLLDAVAHDWGLGRAVASALGWIPASAAEQITSMLYGWGTPSALRIGIAGAAIRRMPIPAKTLQAGLKNLLTRSRTIIAIAELGESNFLPAIRDFLSDADPNVRADAAWAMARLSPDRNAVTELQQIAMVESFHRQRASCMAVRKLEPAAARRWIEMLASLPGCERTAIQAVGALGDPGLVPVLLEKVELPEFARVAAEALGFITGVNLSAEKLETPAPDDPEPVPNDDPRDPRVSLDPDGSLDWPNPAKLRKWWSANQSRFPKGQRLLCGKPITPANLELVLKSGYQRHRAAAALELAILRPREPMVEVRKVSGTFRA
jgi:uncharacterized protein (TIGR02270 family)